MARSLYILQAINTLWQKRLWPYMYKTRFFVLIYSKGSYTYTHASDDHAQVQSYKDGTYCECMTNYGFTQVNFVRNVAHIDFQS